jgi:TetR/AcrR family transcriptional regulator, cholesterol catabolism regulator
MARSQADTSDVKANGTDSGVAASGNGNGNGDDALATDAQRARRRRILKAAAALATEGGFDAVQMREVAERADVALGTLYRYFPSKIHLLVSVLADEMDRLRQRLSANPAGQGDAADRVLAVFQRSVGALQRNPKMYGAVVRAMMFGDESTSTENTAVSDHMDAIITQAMASNGNRPTADDVAIAQLLGKIWLADILSWLAGRSTVEQMQRDLALAVRLLVGKR